MAAPCRRVVGSGPNGLSTAVRLAQAGYVPSACWRPLTRSAVDPLGRADAARFTHDVCSAMHPFAAASPFFRSRHLEEHGLQLERMLQEGPLRPGPTLAALGRALLA